ncbi:hypothetical protein H257_18506 [Aphanomyces astaci]|uniref:Uncharacterized protein n=1 Tax=Aphanomyces astaci TaxID=112090 RepID=W4FCS9_APHAT|nr:hypothetical protein H257_18506 [Aphanomyces astaci]ETV64621.1 hypothetical protein H257_18506 [Aphanomyces astaci]|eukprot:XP_009845883.1 hypothetical protein H257_18506 [Aphanomyces astaci]
MLLMLFIIKGQSGGPLEKKELPTYDPANVYAVQANTWMDDPVWDIYPGLTQDTQLHVE